MNETNTSIPNEYRPLSAWGYVGYNILFCLPLAGFIFVIVFALDNSYIARRNYARSALCWILIGIIISISTLGIFAFLGLSLSSLSY